MKLKLRLGIFIFFILGIGLACQLTSPTPASWSGTPTAKARALTNTAIVLTQGAVQNQDFVVTPTETASAVLPTQTPQPTVTADGPWLVYPSPNGEALHAYDIDAKTINTINLPPPIFWEDLINGLSPDGSKLIMRAGSPTNTDEFGLYAVDFISSEVTKITPLLSLVLQRKIVNNEGTQAFEILEVLSRQNGLAWSPNNRYLAFSAALDNQSSDLYIFDSVKNRVSRMNGLSTQNTTPFWDLNSNRLVSQELGKPKDNEVWRAENVTGVNIPEFNNQNTFYLPISDSQEEVFVGWLNTNTFVSYSLTPEGPSTLRRVNIETYRTSILRQGYFEAVTLDPNTYTLAMIINDQQTANIGEVAGVYFLKPEDVNFKLQRGGIWRDLSWDSGGMFVISGPQGVGLFDPGGEGMVLPDEKKADLSREGNWIIAWDGGARLYQPQSNFPLQTLTENPVDTVFWQPDSKGFFIQSEGTLYHLVFPSLRFQQVENGFMSGEAIPLAWGVSESDG